MRYGLYIHIPFCRRKCFYCGFVSFTDCDDCIPAYITALITEYKSKKCGNFEHAPYTIYIGGGTPSILPLKDIRRLLRALDKSAACEITFEINPDSCSSDLVRVLNDEGVTRVSLGVQSFNDAILQTLGRLHSASQAITAYQLLRQYDFKSVSLDLMFGVPGQTKDAWNNTIMKTLSLAPDHISAYSLGIEEDSVFFQSARQGKLDIPKPSETSDMYSDLVALLSDAGYEWYELSNFARPGKESAHNSGYWDFTPYMGLGVSAHSFDVTTRRWNTSVLQDYIEMIAENEDATESCEKHEGICRTIEKIMLSLRTRNGIDIGSLDLSREQTKHLEKPIEDMQSAGFLEKNAAGLPAVTIKGAVIINELIAELVAVIENI